MKELTIVIQYEGEEPPITGFGIPVLGCEVVALGLGDHIARAWELEERLKLNGLGDEDE